MSAKTAYAALALACLIGFSQATTTTTTTIPFPGTLIVDSVPRGSQVTINGSAVGETPYRRDWAPVDVYRIVISHPYYEVYKKKTEVISYHTTIVNATLQLISMGNILVDSSPPGAYVRIDGFFRGLSPYMMRNITTGQHTISLAKPGYNRYSTSVNVVNLKTAIVNTTLIAVIPETTTTTIIQPQGAWCQGADINWDRTVGERDITIFIKYFGRTDCYSGNGFCKGADIDNDGDVDKDDETRIIKNYKRTDCRPPPTTTLMATTTTTLPRHWWCWGADIDRNGYVDGEDLETVIDNWNRDDCEKFNEWCRESDINRDGFVNRIELDLVNYNKGRLDCNPLNVTATPRSQSTTTSTARDHPPVTTTLKGFQQVTSTTLAKTQTTATMPIRPDDWCEWSDANRDSKVDEKDLAIMKEWFGANDCSPEGGWCAGADNNRDGMVGEKDSSRLNGNFGRHDCTGRGMATTTMTIPSGRTDAGCGDLIRNNEEADVDCGGPCPKCPKPAVGLSIVAPYVAGRGESFAIVASITANRTGKYLIIIDMPQGLSEAGDSTKEVFVQGGGVGIARFDAYAGYDTPYGDYIIGADVLDQESEHVAEAAAAITIEDPLVLETPYMSLSLPRAAELKKTLANAQESALSNPLLIAALAAGALMVVVTCLARVMAAPPAEPKS
ncbi:MAG: PEGA domain-containing protein [Candidatus Altiarchaeota archaeon]